MIEKAEKLLADLIKQWIFSKRVLGIKRGLGAKLHYLGHALEYVRLWRIGIGYISEQSIEGYHQTCSRVFDLYKRQRGIARIQYAIQRLMFVTSPLYRL